jgi:hypothetical protein
MSECLWDRFPEEPSVWFDRFDTFYRPVGPGRTLTEAYKGWYKQNHGGQAPSRAGYQQDWKAAFDQWEWKRRAEAWDTELHRQQIEAERDERIKMSERHMDAAKAVQALALQTILEKGLTDPNLAIRAWRQAVLVERSAAGIPDHLVEIAEMQDDELNAELAKRLAKSGLAGFFGEDEQVGEGETSDGDDASGSSSDGDTDTGPEISGAFGVPDSTS